MCNARRWFLVLVVTLAAGALRAAAPEPADVLPTLPGGQSWRLDWHDEFDGGELDRSKWDLPEYERRGHLWRAANARLDGQGHLLLETSRVGERFASPCVRSRKKYETAFGYFVCRCQLPTQAGHWSAFWLHNDSVNRLGQEGRDGTEIDIMEFPFRDGRVQHTLHWDGYGKEHRQAGQISKPAGVLDGNFHSFALWWSPEEYVFYVDAREVWRTKAGGVCQAPLYIKLSEEIGPWAGDIRQATLPDRFTVDYVRVYKTVPAQK